MWPLFAGTQALVGATLLLPKVPAAGQGLRDTGGVRFTATGNTGDVAGEVSRRGDNTRLGWRRPSAAGRRMGAVYDTACKCLGFSCGEDMVHSGDAEAVFVRLERRVLELDAVFGSRSCPGDLGGLPGGKDNLELSKKGSDEMEWAVDPSVTSVRVARSVTILAVSTSKRLTRMISLRSRAISALTLFSSFRKRLRDVSNMESFDACSMTFAEKTSCFFADSSMRLSVLVPASMISAILDSNDHTAGFHWSGSVREVSLSTTSNLDAKCCTSRDNCECHDSTSSSWRSNLVSMSLTVCCQEERSSDKRSNSVFTWIWKFLNAPLKTCTSDELISSFFLSSLFLLLLLYVQELFPLQFLHFFLQLLFILLLLLDIVFEVEVHGELVTRDISSQLGIACFLALFPFGGQQFAHIVVAAHPAELFLQQTLVGQVDVDILDVHHLFTGVVDFLVGGPDFLGEHGLQEVAHFHIFPFVEPDDCLHHLLLHVLLHFAHCVSQVILALNYFLAFGIQAVHQILFLFVEFLLFPGLAFALDHLFHLPLFLLSPDFEGLVHTFILHLLFFGLFNSFLQLDSLFPPFLLALSLFGKDVLFEAFHVGLHFVDFVLVVFITLFLVILETLDLSSLQLFVPPSEFVHLTDFLLLFGRGRLDHTVVETLNSQQPLVHFGLGGGT